jgi:hypothetical protein
MATATRVVVIVIACAAAGAFLLGLVAVAIPMLIIAKLQVFGFPTRENHERKQILTSPGVFLHIDHFNRQASMTDAAGHVTLPRPIPDPSLHMDRNVPKSYLTTVSVDPLKRTIWGREVRPWATPPAATVVYFVFEPDRGWMETGLTEFRMKEMLRMRSIDPDCASCSVFP